MHPPVLNSFLSFTIIMCNGVHSLNSTASLLQFVQRWLIQLEQNFKNPEQSLGPFGAMTALTGCEPSKFLPV